MTRISTLIPTLCAIAVGVSLVLAGCDSSDPGIDYSDIAEVRISPDSVAMSVGESVDFSFSVHTENGDTVRGLDLNTRWESMDTSVFTVADNGLATAKASGSTKCVIEVSTYPINDGETASAAKVDPSGSAGILGFVGQDSARVVVF